MTLRPEKVDFEQTWSRLRNTLENVIKVRKVTRNEWTERFSDVYKICVAFPEPLCDKLYHETKTFIEQHVRYLHSEVCKVSQDQLLKVYYEHWLNYREGIDYLNELYSYLNIQYIKKQKFSDADMFYGFIEMNDQMLEIRELGLFFWEQNMINPLQEQLTALLLEAIREDRLGRPTNEKVISSVITSLVEVESYKKKNELYQQIFEIPFLQATGEYYRHEAEQLLRNSDCSEYMERVLQRLQAENVRCRKFIDKSSFAKVISEFENRMIADHLNFLHGECHSMVLNERRTDLQNMFSLLKNVKDGLCVLVKEMQEHVTKIGLDAVSVYLDGVAAGSVNSCSNTPEPSSPAGVAGTSSTANSTVVATIVPTTVATVADFREHPLQFVERILEVHARFSNLITEVFANNQPFKRALDNAFSAVINHRRSTKQPCRSPELLAKYCDQLLKKSAAKGLSESEIDEKLASSITVFKYIDDKDVFQKFYSKMLGKRLIHSQSVSMDCEESVINKLKQACGHEFTMKLHRMFTDIKVSDDLTKSFAVWCAEEPEERNLGPINFNIFVLQAGAWPLCPTSMSTFEIPLPLEKSVSNFELYYYSRFSGRRLTWLHFLSSCDVKICLQKKTYLVTMGAYYMAILLLFESSETLSYAYIQESTKLTDEHLLKHLVGLLDAKLLLCDRCLQAETKPEDPETKFTLNLNYSNKRTKFKITSVAQKDPQQQQCDTEQTHASVDEDRKLYLQAAIVRIMKARKVIKHNTLIQEVIQLSKNRFNPNVPMIKKCIEALIDKQYIERTQNNAEEYSYMA